MKSDGTGNGKRPRVLLIGWDCVPPQLAFHEFADDMPNMQRLMAQSNYGSLTSTIPPITVPAWMCMFTGKGPGELGIYGFRNRADRSYGNLKIPNSSHVAERTVWDYLGDHGMRSIVVGVPLTYPPKPLSGWMISGCLTPSEQSEYTYPTGLKGEILSEAGHYTIDVSDFRTEDRERLERDLVTMTRERFRTLRYLMASREWDLCVVVEMGSDRLHHAFWRYWDTTHRNHVVDSPFSDTMRAYYRLLDDELGATLDIVDDETSVLVVSDHGAQRMDGGICVNEVLRRHGYLTLNSEPEGITRLTADMIDWEHTQAWGEGGYYGRVFLNVEGREPQGQIPQGRFGEIRDELKRLLEALEDEAGRNIGTRVFTPEEVYVARRNIPPDLIVYFGDLYWRSIGSVGHRGYITHENDTGPDDCNHAQTGMYLIRTPGLPTTGPAQTRHLLDVGPTLLDLLGLPVPDDMRGSPMTEAAPTEGSAVASSTDDVTRELTRDEQEEIERRLTDLGYL